MTPEHHAEAILRAAGSSLRHYEARTREAILAAVREAVEAERKAIVDWLNNYEPLLSEAIELGRHIPTPPRGE